MQLPSFSVSDIIQIAILYLAIYTILKRARGSRFGQALTGIGIIAVLLSGCTYLFHFDVLAHIVQYLLLYIAVSTVVIFQPEIRRFLSTVGAFGDHQRPRYEQDGTVTPEFVIETIMELSRAKIGALIAFERGISLRSYEGTGVRLDALFSRELVRCVFTPPLPLHDGGITIRSGRISAAHCIFPVSNSPELITSGTRHRAAVGLSEETDALIIVVSEETGSVSVAHNGRLFRYVEAEAAMPLLRWVTKALNRQRRRFTMYRAILKMQQMLINFTKGSK